MGVPYVCLGRDDVAAVGNAILAGYALGIFDDMTVTSERFMQRSTRYEPDPAAHDLYRQYAAFYAKLLDHTEPAYAELAVLP
jgi:sugar (pentulose or hexulose) kinase